MAWVDDFMARAKGFALPAWEELPDLGLYMDQVVTFLERLYRPLYGGERRIITPSMINNYVKSGIVSRPARKKYSREQLAQLAIVCALKQSVSLEDLRVLLTPEAGGDTEAVYRAFGGQVQAAVESFRGKMEGLSPMACAVQSAAYALLCEETLHSIS